MFRRLSYFKINYPQFTTYSPQYPNPVFLSKSIQPHEVAEKEEKELFDYDIEDKKWCETENEKNKKEFQRHFTGS